MAKVITLGMGKGGVGKTTTCVMLSDALCNMGYKVLGVDFDSQGNFTQMSTRRELSDFEDRTIYEAMKEKDPREYIFKIRENLDIIPTDEYLSTLSKYLYKEYKGNPNTLLAETLEVIKPNYDFVIIDLPPNFGDQTINGLASADFVIPIFQPEPFCYEGLSRYIELIYEVKEINPKLEILGILTSMMDSVATMDDLIFHKALNEYGELLFVTIIKRRTRVKEFSRWGIKKDTTRDKTTIEPYAHLAKEVVLRVKNAKGTVSTPQETIR